MPIVNTKRKAADDSARMCASAYRDRATIGRDAASSLVVACTNSFGAATACDSGRGNGLRLQDRRSESAAAARLSNEEKRSESRHRVLLWRSVDAGQRRAVRAPSEASG